MKIVQINSFSNGSTGKIMMSIHKELLKQGHDSYVVWGRGRKAENSNELYLNDKVGVFFHVLYTRLTGKTGFASKKSTKKLLKFLDQIKPDIVHLHNIHGYYINIEMLFNYLKKNNIKVVWTLHDCWAFTGQCPYFSIKNCTKWMTGCENCPMTHEYPKTIKDNSKWNYQEKKDLLIDIKDLKIVTPSKWLATSVKQSYLKKYSVSVINNGIDTNIFKPTPSDFRRKHNLEDKKIILGVASVWDKRKGLQDFIKLSKLLELDYRIVLVGLNKKQINELPENIIGITRTENQKELAGLYSTANILFNPTYEDNYPTVNIEAIACGTPVLTYDTGGSPEFSELLKNKEVKYVIKKEEISFDNRLIKILERIINQKISLKNDYILTEHSMVNKYLMLYKEK